jgi:hypothetical protein
MMWVSEERVGGDVDQIKWIKEFPSQFVMGMKLNKFLNGLLAEGREYLGPIGMDWYPRAKVPWQVVEAFIGCRNNTAMASPEVRIDMPHFESGLLLLPLESPIRGNGLRWVDVVYAYPAGDRPDWEVVPPIRGPPAVQPGEPQAHPVDISDDEVEFVKEVDAPSRAEPCTC